MLPQPTIDTYLQQVPWVRGGVRQTLSPTRRPVTEGKARNAHGRRYMGDLPLPVPGTIARWYELQWISQMFLGPHSYHLHPGTYLPLNKEKGGNLIFCLDNESNQAEMTRSPQASVNAPTASGLKAISLRSFTDASVLGTRCHKSSWAIKKCQTPQPSPSLSLKAIQTPYPPPKLRAASAACHRWGS